MSESREINERAKKLLGNIMATKEREKAQEFIKAYKLTNLEIIKLEENDKGKIKDLINEIKENF